MTQLTEQQIQAIEKEADEYARTYSGTKTIKRPYIAGATAHALACIRKDEEIQALKEQLKQVLHWYNEMGHGRATMNYDVYANAKSLLV